MVSLKKSWKDFTRIVGDAFSGWSKDNASQMAASLAYYTLFAIGPLLLVAVSIAGLFYGEEAAQGELADQLVLLIGDTAAEAVQAFIAQTASVAKNRFSTAVGVAILLVGAATVFAELKITFNRIWNVSPKKTSGITRYLITRLLSFAMVLAVGFLLLVSLILSAVISGVTRYVNEIYQIPSNLVHVGDALFSYFLIGGVFTLIFRLLPDTKVHWYPALVGGMTTSLLFTAGKLAIAVYLGHSAVTSTYGASASVIIILLWTYYSTLILLFGVELTKAIQNLKFPATVPAPT